MVAGVDQSHIKLIQQVQHELRTPLHGLMGLIEDVRQDIRAARLENPSLRRSLLEKTDTLAGLGERLQNVIDDFRDFAADDNNDLIPESSRAGGVVFPEEAVDLGELLDTVAAETWNSQVRQIRAEEGEDARLPPPPELILQTETSLRGWKTSLPAGLVRRLASKLIANALRFTKEGYVEVSITPAIDTPAWERSNLLERPDSPIRSSQAPQYVNLVVEDTGEGMTEHFVSHRLFEPFVKEDGFKSGAGLSMNLCSSLVRRLGGSMHVSSDKGRGTIVTVKLPVESLPEPVTDSTPPSQSDQLIYLYGFEGYGLQRLAQVITAQLATFGNLYCTSHIQDADYLLLPEEVCAEVDGGIDAILSQTKPGVKIGVLQAHEDAGIEYAALRFRSRPPTFVTRKPFGPRCFVNLLRLGEQDGLNDTRSDAEIVREEHGHLGYTARQDPEDPNKTLSDDSSSSGSSPDKGRLANVYQQERANRNSGSSLPGGAKLADLVVSPSTLDQVLRAPKPMPKMEPVRRSSVVSVSSSDTDGEQDVLIPDSRFNVLCCEDNPLNMRILTTLLRQCKIDFHEAVDGEEAVAQFKKHMPAVTLLDINMPKMMGFEACELMRKHVATLRAHDNGTPVLDEDRMFKIVAVTALSDTFHQQKGLDCGMDAWLTKPLSMKALKMDLAKWKQDFEKRQSDFRS